MEYTVLSENYNDMDLKFISFYSVQNELIGLLLDIESELIFGDWIQEAIVLTDQNCKLRMIKIELTGLFSAHGKHEAFSILY